MRSIMHRSVCAISFSDYILFISAFNIYIQINWQNPQNNKNFTLCFPWLLYSTTFQSYKSDILSVYNRINPLQTNTDI